MDINAVQSALDVTNYSDHDAMVSRVNYTGTFTGMACFQRDVATRARGARTSDSALEAHASALQGSGRGKGGCAPARAPERRICGPSPTEIFNMSATEKL